MVTLHGDEFEVSHVDTDVLARFVAAVLWRASITRHEQFSEVRLGPYEQAYSALLFGDGTGPPEVMLMRLISDRFPVDGFYTMPVWANMDGINCYAFALAGFRIIAKVDKRPFPSVYKPYVINGKDRIRGPFTRLEETAEFETMRDIVADRFRGFRSAKQGGR
jgi:hypothetical protein